MIIAPPQTWYYVDKYDCTVKPIDGVFRATKAHAWVRNGRYVADGGVRFDRDELFRTELEAIEALVGRCNRELVVARDATNLATERLTTSLALLFNYHKGVKYA